MKNPVNAIVGIALVVVASQWLSAPVEAGDVLDRIKKKGAMVTATDPEWPPFSSRNDKGEFDGFDIDVAKELSRRMGVTLEYATPSWEETTAGHWNGKWDISVGSMTPTAKRAEHLTFPACYYFGMESLAVHAGNTTIKAPSDANGKRIGVLKASTYEQYLRREPFDIVGMQPLTYRIDDPVVVTYDNEEDAYDALAKGDGVELDGVVDSLLTLMTLIKDGKPFRIVGHPLFRTPLCVAIEPGDQEFSELVKQTVEQMRSDGTLQKLSMKWFAFDLTPP